MNKLSKKVVIETKKLTKYYGKARGIENLTLEINEGEIFGLLGPNGAGKTTTIRVLLDLIYKTSGSARIFGMDVHKNSVEIRQRIAYLPGELGLYKEKSARRNLEYLLGLYKTSVPKRQIEELAQRLRLDLDRKVKELSKGNKQKVGIILALAPKAELLIMDEPTAGLDPLIMTDFYNILHKEQKETNTTVLLSSHLLGEVERVAHRVGIIRDGTLVKLSSIEELKNMALKEIVIDFSTVNGLNEFITKAPENIKIEKGLHEAQVVFTVAREGLSNILGIVSNIPIKDLEICSPALEDIFLKYYDTSVELEPLKSPKTSQVEGI